jgi:hypothetical protein
LRVFEIGILAEHNIGNGIEHCLQLGRLERQFPLHFLALGYVAPYCHNPDYIVVQHKRRFYRFKEPYNAVGAGYPFFKRYPPAFAYNLHVGIAGDSRGFRAQPQSAYVILAEHIFHLFVK